ncbi:glycosyltransferase family 4 protein [Actinoplanes sp. NPDC089786]|uniref:glycosyltransferase family 4 protein n=1 Tax=Actinoplanes sp. NPDC089786 TaxID=3155185 RepID=UPI00342A3746
MATPTSPVVYVALGARRIRAARTLAAELAATGRTVLLVVADLPEWSGVEVPGVTVRKVGSADPGKALRVARKLLLSRRGPLAGAGLLIAGDPEASPIADAAHRQFPGLEVRTDVVTDPGRKPAAADVTVVTPWYPSPNDPFAGAFVRATTEAVGKEAGTITTLHAENWFYSPKGVTGKLIGVTIERELRRDAGLVVEDTTEGELVRAVVPQQTSGSWATWGQEQVERLAEALPTGRIEAPVVHAHTGHYAGVVAAALARDDAKIIVTEHATFLDQIFEHRASRNAYGEMLARADRVLCVGRALLDQIVEKFPQHEKKLSIVPNPVDFDQFAVRPAPPAAPLRWLYVGRMLEHKGVHTLLEAFAKVAAEDDRVTLTLVGNGKLEAQLRERIKELGLGARVTQLPPVRPEEVTGLLHEHDVLTHASTSETFGMTIVEAIATGTPVLAARSQGPAETLHGLDHVAGQLFEVTEDPDEIVTAYRKLVDAWDGLDLAEARRQLRERYGREAVGAQLREIYREVLAGPAAGTTDAVDEPAAPPPVTTAETDRITLVAIDPPAPRTARRFISDLRERGYAVDVIASKPDSFKWFADDDGVKVYGVGEAEEHRFPHRLEHVVVKGFPRRALGYLRARAKDVRDPMPEALAIAAQRGHKYVADRVQGRIYNPYYSVVRPRVMWKIARRRVLPKLDLRHTRRIVVYGIAGVTIGWGLARQNPSIVVGTDMSLPEPLPTGRAES